MGLFLTFSIIKNKTLIDTENELKAFALSNSGGLEKADVTQGDPNFCSLLNDNFNTIITYPEYFTEYYQSSEYLSKNLDSAVFTFNIYDGDYWILHCYNNGQLSSRFNPYPSYWSEKEDRELMKTWNFNVAEFCTDFNVTVEDLSKYFVEWTKSNRKKRRMKATGLNMETACNYLIY